MKKSNIAFLFQKHEAKKVATCAPPIPAVDEELSIPVVEDPLIVSDESAIVVVDEGTETPRVTDTDTDPTGDNGSDEVEEEEEEEPPTAADVDSLEHDPGLRSPISTFDVNEQNSIRRRYILKGPCHEFYGLVYLVLKLALILLMATASVERVFSALCLVKK